MEEKHILGIVASKAYNMNTKTFDYFSKMEVSKDVLDWLAIHDTRVDEFGNTIYICNEVEYIYLGLKQQTVILTGQQGEA